MVMGIGGLIRTNAGTWFAGFSSCEGLADSLKAELLAVKHGLSLAWGQVSERFGAKLILWRWCNFSKINNPISTIAMCFSWNKSLNFCTNLRW